jgi:O-acetylhomoserine (thiol)-lyase
MPRHSENALTLARHLSDHPQVGWVRYPGLEQDPAYDLAKRYLSGGFGALVAFGVKGGLDAGRKLIDTVELWSLLANIGDTRSLIIHPASTTHQQLSAEDRVASGVTDDMVRLSVGLEHAGDLIDALDRALDSL